MPGKPRERSRPAERRSSKRATRPLLVLTVGLTPPDAYWLRRIERRQRFRLQPIGDFTPADNPEGCPPPQFVAGAGRDARRRDPKPRGDRGLRRLSGDAAGPRDRRQAGAAGTVPGRGGPLQPQGLEPPPAAGVGAGGGPAVSGHRPRPQLWAGRPRAALSVLAEAGE